MGWIIGIAVVALICSAIRDAASKKKLLGARSQLAVPHSLVDNGDRRPGQDALLRCDDVERLTRRRD
jgi:hypothetical protein